MTGLYASNWPLLILKRLIIRRHSSMVKMDSEFDVRFTNITISFW